MVYVYNIFQVYCLGDYLKGFSAYLSNKTIMYRYGTGFKNTTLEDKVKEKDSFKFLKNIAISEVQYYQNRGHVTIMIIDVCDSPLFYREGLYRFISFIYAL